MSIAHNFEDLAFEEWIKQDKTMDGPNLSNLQRSHQKVPIKLSPKLQVFVPMELSLIVQQLWEKTGLQFADDSGVWDESTKRDHKIHVWSSFLRVVCDTTPENPSSAALSASSRLYLMRLALHKLREALGNNNIHSVTRGKENQTEIIRSYNQAIHELKENKIPEAESEDAISCDSALLQMAKESEIGLFAVFGGQGVQWLNELRVLYSTYTDLKPIIERATGILQERAKHPSVRGHFRHGIDIVAWIKEEPTSARLPPREYLSSAPVSYPCIGLTQLVQYISVVYTWKKPLQQIVQSFKGTTGHSQGIIASTVMASSKTTSELIENTLKGVSLLFWIGVRLQDSAPFPPNVSRNDVLQESRQNGLREPTPMMAVYRLLPAVVQKYIDVVNRSASLSKDPEKQIEIALKNGRTSCVVVGHPESLHTLAMLLYKTETPLDKAEDQTRIPHSKRKKEFSLKYLSVSVPFHSKNHLNKSVNMLLADIKEASIQFNAKDLLIPVYSTEDGSDLRKCTNLTEELIRLNCVKHVDWLLATSKANLEQGVTHVIDFGPGETSGIGVLCSRNMEGTGVQVILASCFNTGATRLPDKSILFECRKEAIPIAVNWEREFGPKLIVRHADGKVLVDTKFTRLLGKPPVMMAGMTPTTVNPHIVAACLNAGYHGELAGGGLPTKKMYREAMDKVMQEADSGNGLTLNLLFLNQRLWSFQYPMIETLRQEGYPIEGVTIAAGVPSVEKSTEILSNLHNVGLKHVSFKPGSLKAIETVVQIASQNPHVDIILQWTGGRAGGHHSFEDFHTPILESYGSIRQQKNIVLVAGSGFGDADDSFPYITGAWSVKFGYPPMPFDGILISSRVMVAKEAATAYQAKELLVATPGVSREEEWEKSYDDVAGGVMTVLSELGEPIHKIANRGLKLWREFDKEIFALPADKQAAKILEKKDYIIKRLNADFQKVYFGKKFDGTVVDLENMTYAEVLTRMVQLMFVPARSSTDPEVPSTPSRWIHPDFMQRVFDFASRIEERFCARRKDISPSVKGKKSILPPLSILKENPQEWLAVVVDDKHYPEAVSQSLSGEDVDYFVQLCRQRGRKPVNFIPVVDKDLQFWFKKDSLWQSEDLDAVQDQDVGRVVILQGPVAVKYSTKVNEPLKDIFNGIHDGWVKKLSQHQQSKTIEYVGGAPQVAATLEPPVGTAEWVDTKEKDVKLLKVKLPNALEKAVDIEKWRDWLSQGKSSWWRALLTTAHVVQGKRWEPNNMKKIFDPRPGQSIHLRFVNDQVTRVDIYDSFFLAQDEAQQQPILQVLFKPDNTFSVTIFHFRPGVKRAEMVPLQFNYRYVPQQGTSLVHEIIEGKNQRIKQFYGQLWFEGDFKDLHAGVSPMKARFEHSFTPSDADIENFCRAVGRSIMQTPKGNLRAAIDFAIVTSWEPLIKSLFIDAVDGNILNLVHLSNSFRRLNEEEASAFIESGVPVLTRMDIVEIANVPSGQRVTVQGTVGTHQQAKIQLRSQFLFRGHQLFQNTLQRNQVQRIVHVEKKEVLAVLKSKDWIKWTDDNVALGDTLYFKLDVVEEQGSDGLSNFKTTGHVLKVTNSNVSYETEPSGAVIGSVDHTAQKVKGNKILGLLQRFGKPYEQAVFFPTGGYAMLAAPDKVSARDENQTYALASKDLNPIHTNWYMATLAELPTTITHGMWSSANAFRVVQSFAAKNDPTRVLNFSTDFVGMVFPGDRLETQIKHVGMKGGRILVEVVTKKNTGEIVLKGSAELRSPTTSYVFTGQGSAEKGMGMDLYQSSPIAKHIWDTADNYFLNTYGFSILSIVRENLKETTIYFGGTKGEQIRENYRKLTQQVQVKEHGITTTKERPLFPDISDASSSFTFRHLEGLLFATQFSQPALVLVELAAFMDMKSRGLVPSDCIFAGHSLGEYAALASVASVISTENLVDIVFLRGMTMQNAVIRDKMGRSPYAMVAVNPGRVHATKFSERELNKVIEAVLVENPELLQVVNYNIENYQYVVAGERGNLHTMSIVLTELKKDLSKINSLPALVKECIKVTKAQTDPDTGVVPLDRGIATIPLPGIDVPFHSKYLKDGVPAFRQILCARMHPTQLDPSVLTGRYIPNVTAQPFSLDQGYIQTVYDATNSDILKQVLDNYPSESKNAQMLGYKLLVELLAYQFASPVRWIETQHLFFGEMNVERLIEVGPAPTLITMAQRTIQLSPDKYPLMTREILWYGRDRSLIYFEHGDVEQVEEAKEEVQAAPLKEQAPVPQPVVQPQPQEMAIVLPAASVPDVPPTPAEFLKVLLSIRLKKPLNSIEDSSNIKQLVGGKSALQNELLGDLENEFGGKMAEDVSDVAISKVTAPSYKKLGKLSSSLISKLVSAKMPGGFGLSQIKSHLNKKFGLGEGRTEGVLLHALTMEPANRLNSQAEAESFLDTVVASYSAKVGQPINAGQAAPAVQMQVSAMVMAVPNSVPDEPVPALMALRIMLALKLKRSVEAIAQTATIKDLVGGKSALQNELLGDMAKEFGTEPDNAAEMDLAALAQRLAPSYKKLGSYFNALISKFISTKMPGGFAASSIKSYLSGKYGLGEGRTEGVLLQALTMEPPNRLQTEGDAKSFLDTVVTKYTSTSGVTLSATAPAGPIGQGVQGSVPSAEFTNFKASMENLIQRQLSSYQEFLGEDSLNQERLLQMEQTLRQEAEKNWQLFLKEHGETYTDGIHPVFSSLRERRFNSSWNWIRQDLLTLYYDYACGRATNWSNAIRERLYHIKNRANANSLGLVEYYIKKAEQDGFPEITQFITLLHNTLAEVVKDEPRYRELKEPSAPDIFVDSNGSIQYREVRRPQAKDMIQYVEEMAKGSHASRAPQKADEDPIWQQTLQHLVQQKVDPKVIQMLENSVKKQNTPAENIPYLFLRTEDTSDPNNRCYDKELTEKFLNVMRAIATEGVTFKSKTILITGCGKDSIGLELVKGLLRGGARVYATTSHFSAQGSKLYQTVYDHHGAKGSELVVLPFNQASVQDITALVDYIYDKEKADIDYIIPFAALSEKGMDVGDIGSKAELAHRIMLTNTLRLIGAVKNKKQALAIRCRPAHVLLPLSPNHGTFGGDGLYAESKLGLEALLNKWKSENWSSYLTMAGAVIGWTRGTGLMEANNIVAPGIESQLGVRTFTATEMCFNLISLLHPQMVALSQKAPLLADLNGGLHAVKDLNDALVAIRAQLHNQASLQKAINLDSKFDSEVEVAAEDKEIVVTPKANIKIEFPSLPSPQKLEQLKSIKGLVDLEKVVVVTGFGEIGPLGNSRTRWEMEAYGEFSLEGCIELAWMMGLIKYSKEASSWVDAKSGKVIHNHEVKPLYEEHILKSTGIRLVEPQLVGGYDPMNKTFLHQIALNQDLAPVEVSPEEAQHFKQKHKDAVDIFEKEGTWFMKMKKGAVMYVPKALKFDRFVAGQVPSSWDPAILGIPEDIIKQVDRVTLFTLVSTVEALISAGVTDPYEFYQYVHVSELGNTVGGGMGGMNSLRDIHTHRFIEKPVQSDQLQETFINTVGAWLNMLLFSSSGPIKTPVGACATAVESVEIAVDTIRSGRAKIVIVGGYDDFGEEGSYEFAQMKATSNSAQETAAGREPKEMSRPATSTRSGFMEAQGSGVEILMSADLAIKMGLPIYGIVEHVSTATDKEGRSVPAPGQGILTTAREVHQQFASPLLDTQYRKKQLDWELQSIEKWKSEERENLTKYVESCSNEQKLSKEESEALAKQQLEMLDSRIKLKTKAAYDVWGNNFYRQYPYISPLRGALAVYGLSVDDIGVASFHGTGTKANDLNETQVLQRQLQHLGRSKGNPILSIWQKYLTGHPKGGAAAWMLNGLLQSMHSGVVPGNRNADNIDKDLEASDLVVFLNRSLETYGFKAGLLKSFGFGQVGGEILVIHPDYLLAQLDEGELQTYDQKRQRRQDASYRYLQNAFTGRDSYVKVKTTPPYAAVDEQKVYLDPLARATYNPQTKTWAFKSSKGYLQQPQQAPGGDRQDAQSATTWPQKEPTLHKRNLSSSSLVNLEVTLREMGEGLRTTIDRGIGIDTQLISEIDDMWINNSEFFARNFTDTEIAYCRASSDTSASFAGRWAAKEAVIKAISSCDIEEKSRNLWKGAGAPLKDIEITQSSSGAPKVTLHGYALEVANLLGINFIKVAISHSGEYAIAQAIAR